MAWTESRSRDEWLAEVKRRGGRMRRRRQLVMAVVGVLALAVPVSAMATFLGHDPDVQVSVAGPPPAVAVAVQPNLDAATGLLALPDEPAPATTTTSAPTLRVDAVHDRTEPPAPTRTVPPADDPVVRPATTTSTTAPAGNSTEPGPGAARPAGVPLLAAEPTPPPAPCTEAEVRLTFSLERDAYRTGEMVRGSLRVERRSTSRCSIPLGVEFGILSPAGNDVFEFGGLTTGSDTEAGVFYGNFEWEALDCAPQRLSPIVRAPGDRSGCIPFPAGRYTVVPRVEESPLTASATFQLS